MQDIHSPLPPTPIELLGEEGNKCAFASFLSSFLHSAFTFLRALLAILVIFIYFNALCLHLSIIINCCASPPRELSLFNFTDVLLL
jgi:hypothetical protein